MTDLIWGFIFCQMMGAFDSLYHHELTQRLAWRPSQRGELALHGVWTIVLIALIARGAEQRVRVRLSTIDAALGAMVGNQPSSVDKLSREAHYGQWNATLPLISGPKDRFHCPK